MVVCGRWCGRFDLAMSPRWYKRGCARWYKRAKERGHQWNACAVYMLRFELQRCPNCSLGLRIQTWVWEREQGKVDGVESAENSIGEA